MSDIGRNDWERVVVVDPRDLDGLKRDNVRLARNCRWMARGLYVFVVSVLGATIGLWWQTSRFDGLVRSATQCRRDVERANTALAALAQSQDKILAATEQAPSVGTKSWGRRFTVTKYIPRSPAYGKDNDGLTATLMKADPRSRIVAVDPKLIPYGSSVWVEGQGWFQAQDCGSAIKGFRLDLLTETESDAMAFGKRELFAIVVPTDVS